MLRFPYDFYYDQTGKPLGRDCPLCGCELITGETTIHQIFGIICNRCAMALKRKKGEDNGEITEGKGMPQ